MLWYVAIVAVVNLALGYMLAQYTSPRQVKATPQQPADESLDGEAN